MFYLELMFTQSKCDSNLAFDRKLLHLFYYEALNGLLNYIYS